VDKNLKATLTSSHKAELQSPVSKGKDQKNRGKQRAKCLVLAPFKINPP